MIAVVALMGSCTTKPEPISKESLVFKLDSAETSLNKQYDSLGVSYSKDTVALQLMVDGPKDQWNLSVTDSLMDAMKLKSKKQAAVVYELEAWRKVRQVVNKTNN